MISSMLRFHMGDSGGVGTGRRPVRLQFGDASAGAQHYGRDGDRTKAVPLPRPGLGQLAAQSRSDPCLPDLDLHSSCDRNVYRRPPSRASTLLL